MTYTTKPRPRFQLGRGSHSGHRRSQVTITVSTTDPRSIKALALLATADRWQKGHTRAGRPFYAVPGSQPNLFHMTDGADCSCPDRRHRGVVCCHMLAAQLYRARLLGAEPKPRRPKAEPKGDGTPIGTLRELRLSTCMACGSLAHGSEQERQKAHAVIAAAVWGRDDE